MDMTKIKGHKDTHMLKKGSYKDIHIHGNNNAQAHSSSGAYTEEVARCLYVVL